MSTAPNGADSAISEWSLVAHESRWGHGGVYTVTHTVSAPHGLHINRPPDVLAVAEHERVARRPHIKHVCICLPCRAAAASFVDSAYDVKAVRLPHATRRCYADFTVGATAAELDCALTNLCLALKVLRASWRSTTRMSAGRREFIDFHTKPSSLVWAQKLTTCINACRTSCTMPRT